MYIHMTTKKTADFKRKKTNCSCEFCGKLGNSKDMIHKKCIFDFLRSNGFEILDTNLQRVFFGGKYPW